MVRERALRFGKKVRLQQSSVSNLSYPEIIWPTRWGVCEEFTGIVIVEASDGNTPSYGTAPPAAGALWRWND